MIRYEGLDNCLRVSIFISIIKKSLNNEDSYLYKKNTSNLWSYTCISGKFGEEEGRICGEDEKQDSDNPQGSGREKGNDWSQTWGRSSQGRGDGCKIPCYWKCSKEVTGMLLMLKFSGSDWISICIFSFMFLYWFLDVLCGYLLEICCSL